MQTKISIVVPTFNRCQDLQITIDSILEQEFSDYEVIVVDNGPSHDGTNQLMQNYVKTYAHIKYYQTALAGVVFARSLGSMLATGEIILQIDDDVTFLDRETLSKTERIFRNFEVDILGVLALKQEALVQKAIQRSQGVAVGSIVKLNHLLQGIGNISFLYDLTKGFEQLVEEPVGLYKIESFQGCFLAYSSSAFQKLQNWDVNYAKVGSKISIREETDLLVRARSSGLQIYYTNYTSVLHRVAQRSNTLVARGKGAKHYFYYASAHSYMAMKDMLETSSKKRIGLWVIHQLLIGQFKNPGLLFLLKSKSGIRAICSNFAGFFYGFLFALIVPRKFLGSPEQYLIGTVFEAEKSTEAHLLSK